MALQPLTSNDILRVEAECEASYGEMIKYASRIQSKVSRELFCYVLEQARINANDTVYVERASDDWKGMFIGSIETLMSFDTWGSKYHGTVGQLNQMRKHLTTHFARCGVTY